MYKKVWLSIKSFIAELKNTEEELTLSGYPINDVGRALIFLEQVNDNEPLVLLVNKKEDIPYVKREVLKIMHVPSKMIDNDLWYDRRIVKVCVRGEDYGEASWVFGVYDVGAEPHVL